MIKALKTFSLAAFPIIFFSCKGYKQNILFKVDEATWIDSISTEHNNQLQQYTIKQNDQLEIKVYANNGE